MDGPVRLELSLTAENNPSLSIREGWHISTANMDLAHMMAMLWYPDRRRRIVNHTGSTTLPEVCLTDQMA